MNLWNVDPKYNKESKVVVESDGAFKGKCLILKGESDNASTYISNSRLCMEAAKQYRLGFYYRTTSLAEGYPEIIGKIGFRDENGRDLNKMFFHPKAPANQYAYFTSDFFTDPKTVHGYIWLGAKGRGTVWIDEIIIQPVEQTALAMPCSVLARRLLSAPEAVVWCENPSANVLPVADFPLLEKLPVDASATICAAKGEYEPFQLVISARQELKDVHLDLTDLKCGVDCIKKELIKWNAAGCVNITKAIRNLNSLGPRFDLLLPQGKADVVAGKSQPFWITVRIPAEAEAGEYTGKIRMFAGNKFFGETLLKLTVWDFTLPKENPLKTYFEFNDRWATRFDRRPSKEILVEAYQNFKEHRVAGGRSFYDGNWPKIQLKDGRLSITDFAEFDEYFKPIAQYGFHTRFPIPGIGRKDLPAFSGGLWSDRGKWLDFDLQTPEFEKYFEEYCRQIGKHLEEKGLLDCCMAYVYDEPQRADFDRVCRLAEIIKKGCPKIPTMVTKQPEPGLYGSSDAYDIWVMGFPGLYVPEICRSRMEKKEELWGYNYPMSLEIPLVEHRLYTWWAYQAELKGLLLWSVNNWRNRKVSPLDDPTPRSGPQDMTPAGGAVALYPHPSGNGPLVNSIRWENVREAMEDYAYFWVLEKMLDGTKKNLEFSGYSSKKRIQELIGFLSNAPGDSTKDSAALYRVRELIAKEIIEVKKKPLILLQSDFPENATLNVNAVVFSGKAEKNASISVDGNAVNLSNDGSFSHAVLLKEGQNLIRFEAAHDGKKKVFHRQFTVKSDPSLKMLEEKISFLKNQGMDLFLYNDLLCRAKVCYGKEEKAAVGEALKILDAKELEILLARAKSAPNVCKAYRSLVAEAERQRQRGRMDRARYYLCHADVFGSLKELDSWPVTLEIVDYYGHLAYKIKNSVLDITILETGGKIVEFNVGGVPTIHLNIDNLKQDYPEEVRENWDKLKQREWLDIGGYEDWGEWKWSLSHLNWDFKIMEASPNRIVIAASVAVPASLTPGATFKLERMMSLEKGQPFLKIDYKVSNLAPKEEALYQQDPYQYLFHWRAHTEFSIGKSPAGDLFAIPSEERMRCSGFNEATPELFSDFVNLTKNYMGAFDPAEKTGLFYILPPQIKEGLVFYDSKSSGGYNLEVFRSNIKGLAKIGKPMNICPGETASFSLYLLGVSGVETLEEALKLVDGARKRLQ
ncbi:MAG: DUF6067 family protein [Verrucomicrobiae bacterium]|nr:DUF6067 family protein [Verrucomicrobiae bacterium]